MPTENIFLLKAPCLSMETVTTITRTSKPSLTGMATSTMESMFVFSSLVVNPSHGQSADGPPRLACPSTHDLLSLEPRFATQPRL
jgi:hypothetical protein